MTEQLGAMPDPGRAVTLGEIHAALCHTCEAHTAWAESAALYEQLGAPRAAEAGQRLSKEVHTDSVGA